MTKKTRIRIGIIVVIVGVMGFSDWSFAEDNKDIMVLGFNLDYIVSSLAWLWVIFAKGAGEFLTNKWVYGEILGLDVLLRKYWNIVKNFANFGLGFYFVYTIFKGLISTGKQSISATLKNNLLWLIVAGIGIQASWFLTALLIDTSTITLAAAGALPSQILSSNANISKSVEDNLRETFTVEGSSVTEPIQLDLFCSDSKASEFLCKPEDDSKLDTPQSLTGLIDQMMPRADDVSGPLYFIGFSILDTTKITSFNSADYKGIMATIFNLIIQGGTTIIFAIEMLVLCVVAIIRVFYLWMFIMLSPIAVLLWCIGQTGDNKLKDTELYKNINKHLNINAILINVFKPTIIVLGLGVAVIFASFMKTTISNFAEKPFNYKGVEFSSQRDLESNQNKGDTKYTNVMNHDLFSFTLRNVGKTLLGFILSVLTVILVYQIIKTAVTIGGGKDDIIGKRINKIQEGVGNILGSVPILPVAGYDKEGAPTTHYISANKVFDIKNGEPTSELLNRAIAKYDGEIRDSYNKDNEIINSWFGDDTTGYLSKEEKNKITNARINNINDGMAALKAMKDAIPKTDNGQGMKLNPQAVSDDFWIREFWAWLEGMKDQKVNGTSYNEVWDNMIKRWNDDNRKENRTLQGMFENVSGSAKAYAQYFFDEPGDERSNISDWTHLKNADISKKKSEKTSE